MPGLRLRSRCRQALSPCASPLETQQWLHKRRFSPYARTFASFAGEAVGCLGPGRGAKPAPVAVTPPSPSVRRRRPAEALPQGPDPDLRSPRRHPPLQRADGEVGSGAPRGTVVPLFLGTPPGASVVPAVPGQTLRPPPDPSLPPQVPTSPADPLCVAGAHRRGRGHGGWMLRYGGRRGDGGSVSLPPPHPRPIPRAVPGGAPGGADGGGADREAGRAAGAARGPDPAGVPAGTLRHPHPRQRHGKDQGGHLGGGGQTLQPSQPLRVPTLLPARLSPRGCPSLRRDGGLGSPRQPGPPSPRPVAPQMVRNLLDESCFMVAISKGNVVAAGRRSWAGDSGPRLSRVSGQLVARMATTWCCDRTRPPHAASPRGREISHRRRSELCRDGERSPRLAPSPRAQPASAVRPPSVPARLNRPLWQGGERKGPQPTSPPSPSPRADGGCIPTSAAVPLPRPHHYRMERASPERDLIPAAPLGFGQSRSCPTPLGRSRPWHRAQGSPSRQNPVKPHFWRFLARGRGYF